MCVCERERKRVSECACVRARTGAMMLRVYHIMYLFKLQMITKYLAIDASLIVRNEAAIKQV